MSDEQKIALVTGASRGIGKAIASHLAATGTYVAGTATSQAGADAIKEQLGDGGTGLVMQLRDDDAIASALEVLEAQAGVPTILVNNAGVTRDNLLMRMSPEEWEEVIDTNLTGAYRVTRACLRGMLKARWGRIVNIGSVVARMGNPGQGNYVASKAAIEGFSRSLALEVASRNITVNTIAPGFIDTDMTDELTEEQTQTMLDRIPLRRVGRVNEVAAAVAFFCSDEAAYITAQTLEVNGGLYAI